MKSKKSILFSIMVVFTGYYLVISTINFAFITDGIAADFHKKRFARILAQQKTNYTLLEANDLELIVELMEFMHQQVDVDYYKISGPDIDIQKGAVPEFSYIPNEINDHGKKLDLMIANSGYSVVMGINTDYVAFHKQSFLESQEIIYRDLILVLGLGLIVLSFYFRDFWKVLTALKTGKLEDLKKTKSKEALLIQESFKSFEKQLVAEKDENELLKNQLLPALKSELFSGQTPPYEFNCTLLRTDINFFSKILKENDKNEFLDTVNQYFTACTKVISRYNGVVSEFLGDEVIYYFKDREDSDSCSLALSAVRDIHKVTEEFHRKMMAERGYPFITKTSMSWGEIVFTKQVDRFTLSGAPLIETVRILSEINNRERNLVWMSADVQKRVGILAESHSLGVHNLKGLHPLELFEVRQFAEVIETYKERELRQYFRSDTDWVFLTEKFLSKEHWDLEKQELLTNLRTNPIYGAGSQLRDHWIANLNNVLASPGSERRPLLASLVSSSKSVLVEEELNPSEKDTLRSLLNAQDERVVANTIDLVSHFSDPVFSETIRFMQSHKNHRIAAAAVSYELKTNWNDSSLGQLKQQVQSLSPSRQLSGLWALRQVHDHYAKENPVQLTSSEKYLSIAFEAKKLKKSSHLSIRRAALAFTQTSELTESAA